MITLSNTIQQTKTFRELVEFFNKLEKDLEYPNCETEADKVRVLIKAENELIMWGKV